MTPDTEEEEEEAGKRQWRRKDDVEEELLSSGVQKYSIKQWEKVQQPMGTDRNIKQLSAHWGDTHEVVWERHGEGELSHALVWSSLKL